MFKIFLAGLLFLLCACRSAPAEHRVGASAGSPAQPVVVVDGIASTANILGADPTHPFYTTGTGGGGASSVSIVNDAGNLVPIDNVPSDQLNAFVSQNTPGVQQVLIDAGTRCVLDINFTNEGTVTGYGDVFCGQYAPDASGTAGAATVPNLQIRCPGGTICGQQLKAPLCCAGAVWYSSVDAGFLNTSSAPALTLTAAALR